MEVGSSQYVERTYSAGPVSAVERSESAGVATYVNRDPSIEPWRLALWRRLLEVPHSAQDLERWESEAMKCQRCRREFSAFKTALPPPRFIDWDDCQLWRAWAEIAVVAIAVNRWR